MLIKALSNEPFSNPSHTGKIQLVLGGARSGKSEYAEQLVLELGGSEVSYIATAQAFDKEMEKRIDIHQQRREETWETLEIPLHVSSGISEVKYPTVLLDCLTLLITNWFLEKNEEAAEREVRKLIVAARKTRGTYLLQIVILFFS